MQYISNLTSYNTTIDRIGQIHPRNKTQYPTLTLRMLYYLRHLRKEYYSIPRERGEDLHHAARKYLVHTHSWCSICSFSDKLQVHHRYYAELDVPDPDCLIVVCARCHRIIHARGDR